MELCYTQINKNINFYKLIQTQYSLFFSCNIDHTILAIDLESIVGPLGKENKAAQWTTNHKESHDRLNWSSEEIWFKRNILLFCFKKRHTINLFLPFEFRKCWKKDQRNYNEVSLLSLDISNLFLDQVFWSYSRIFMFLDWLFGNGENKSKVI